MQEVRNRLDNFVKRGIIPYYKEIWLKDAIFSYHKEKLVMGNFEKHLSLAREKLQATADSYKKKQNTVVGDIATKVVEQLIEADATRSNMHFGDHRSRHEYSNKNFPPEINNAMRRIWFAYGDLGYDGINGKRAKLVMGNLNKVVKFFDGKFGVRINE